MKLIYSCVFFQAEYLDLLSLLLKSLTLYGNMEDDTDYLVICNDSLRPRVETLFKDLDIRRGKLWCLPLTTKFEACYSRLLIFDYPEIERYHKILYLDCDILIPNDIGRIFDTVMDEKLHVKEEGHNNHPYLGFLWGAELFEKDNPNTEAFTSGILCFQNTLIIKNLFSTIVQHIRDHIEKGLPEPVTYDQPFLIYHAIRQNLVDHKRLDRLVVNHNGVNYPYQEESISHFPGPDFVGNHSHKLKRMKEYFDLVLQKKKSISLN